jgi:hypothetical protein
MANPALRKTSEEFCDASFEILANMDIKASISGVIMRFHGYIEKINPDSFTDIVLTRNGNAVACSLTYSGLYRPATWGNSLPHRQLLYRSFEL